MINSPDRLNFFPKAVFDQQQAWELFAGLSKEEQTFVVAQAVLPVNVPPHFWLARHIVRGELTPRQLMKAVRSLEAKGLLVCYLDQEKISLKASTFLSDVPKDARIFLDPAFIIYIKNYFENPTNIDTVQ